MLKNFKFHRKSFFKRCKAFVLAFNCDSQDDKEEIVKMFYAFNIICRNDNQSSSDDFIRKYKEIYGNLDLNNYSNQLKGSISLTLSKQFYSNLFDEIVEKQTKLDDILQLIVVYENEISRLTWYQSKYSELNNFLNNYVNMQDEAFKILADKCGISYDELRQIYEQYNKSRNTNISWLSDEKNAFYNYITNTRFNDKKDSIYTVYTNNYSYVKTIN